MPLGDIIRRHGLGYHLYTDDTQLYLSFDLGNPASQTDAKLKLEKCIIEIQDWMKFNKLKLNGDKTEIVLLSSQFNRREVHIDNIQIGDVDIWLSLPPLLGTLESYLTVILQWTFMFEKSAQQLTIISGTFHPFEDL